MKVHHMVLVKFKSGNEGMADPLMRALAELKKRNPGMLHFAGGPYASPEGLNQGYTHGFLMTFADALARDQYLVHPEHEKVKDAFLPYVAAVVAFDIEDAN
ncbi:MAG: Dabb family protein [Gemmataceae bacterium]|nr:Dabb family protein [Gemmataceae bacterium]MCI0741043.1 Dabb family protein [Gemmataceae bacterium]